jgi:elongation factor P
MKLRNLLSGSTTETVYRADEKFDIVVLDRKEVTYSFFADPAYVFMDSEFNQYEVDKESMGDGLNYLEDGMECESCSTMAIPFRSMYVDRRAKSPIPARGAWRYVRQVLKPAKLKTGFEVQAPLFCSAGDKIEIICARVSQPGRSRAENGKWGAHTGALFVRNQNKREGNRNAYRETIGGDRHSSDPGNGIG